MKLNDWSWTVYIFFLIFFIEFLIRFRLFQDSISNSKTIQSLHLKTVDSHYVIEFLLHSLVVHIKENIYILEQKNNNNNFMQIYPTRLYSVYWVLK